MKSLGPINANFEKVELPPMKISTFTLLKFQLSVFNKACNIHRVLLLCFFAFFPIHNKNPDFPQNPTFPFDQSQCTIPQTNNSENCHGCAPSVDAISVLMYSRYGIDELVVVLNVSTVKDGKEGRASPSCWNRCKCRCACRLWWSSHCKWCQLWQSWKIIKFTVPVHNRRCVCVHTRVKETRGEEWENSFFSQFNNSRFIVFWNQTLQIKLSDCPLFHTFALKTQPNMTSLWTLQTCTSLQM